jgi:hypothetical protein
LAPVVDRGKRSLRHLLDDYCWIARATQPCVSVSGPEETGTVTFRPALRGADDLLQQAEHELVATLGDR